MSIESLETGGDCCA